MLSYSSFDDGFPPHQHSWRLSSTGKPKHLFVATKQPVLVKGAPRYHTSLYYWALSCGIIGKITNPYRTRAERLCATAFLVNFPKTGRFVFTFLRPPPPPEFVLSLSLSLSACRLLAYCMNNSTTAQYSVDQFDSLVEFGTWNQTYECVFCSTDT